MRHFGPHGFKWLPIALASFQEQFDLNGLLRFPVGFGSFYLLNLVFGLVDVPTILGGICSIGILTGVTLALESPLGIGGFFLPNLFGGMKWLTGSYGTGFAVFAAADSFLNSSKRSAQSCNSLTRWGQYLARLYARRTSSSSW